MTVNPGDIVRTALSYSAPGASEQQNVFFHTLEGGSQPDLDILNSINAWVTNIWHPAWADLCSGEAEIVSFAVDVVNPDGTVARNLGGLPVGLSGGVGGEVTSAAVSGYLLAYTILPKQRGSKYIPGVAEASITNGLFNAEALGDLAVLLALYLGYIDVAAVPLLRPGVLSRTLETFVDFLESGLIEVRPAYQRRRKLGVGI